MLDTLYNGFAGLVGTLNDLMYSYVLIILLLAAGVYFTIRTAGVQVRLLGESVRVVSEKSGDTKAVSAFEALMVSTASRVGTGNIVGVANAIAIGGYGSVFWMWLIALVGGATAFVESTLAQIYKKRSAKGGSYGGPSYYIQAALGSRSLGIIFAIALIATYAVGFNMLASFNLIDSMSSYHFYDTLVTASGAHLLPIIGGAAGFGSSALMQGIKRGLYSNEAGVGSAPNAAAAADVSHPVKQGLVQMLSVFIDTILVCTATAMMCLCTGIEPSESLKGAPFVQASLEQTFGAAGPYFITIALLLFAFTTLLGNLFYCEGCLNYIAGRTISHRQLNVFHAFACVVVFIGAQMKFGLVWDIADVLMGIMALINLPVILRLGGTAMRALSDYMKQRREGRNPVFKAKNIALKEKTDYWN